MHFLDRIKKEIIALHLHFKIMLLSESMVVETCPPRQYYEHCTYNYSIASQIKNNTRPMMPPVSVYFYYIIYILSNSNF